MARRRLDVKQAAQVLGISTDAVHKRAKRGTLEAEKDANGKVYFWIDDGYTPDDDRRDELVAALQDQISALKSEVEAWREEARRKDTILMNMTEAMKALNPPPDTQASPEPRESPVTPSEPRSDTRAPPQEERPSWWRRWFGTG